MQVSDFILDNGCSQTMVRHELVLEEKILVGEAVMVRCAHGDTVLYPLADIELEVDGSRLKVRAAVSKSLPASVLLGTDVPEMRQLLGAEASNTGYTHGVGEVMVVTRGMAREQARVENECRAREQNCGG